MSRWQITPDGYVEITLTPDEFEIAGLHAIARRKAKLAGMRQERSQRMQSDMNNEVYGACAELAFCGWQNIYWSGAAAVRAKDAGMSEVRWTCHEGRGGLIVNRHDDDASCYVLMEGVPPVMRVIGRMRGADAKRLGDLQDFGFLVPRALVPKINLERVRAMGGVDG